MQDRNPEATPGWYDRHVMPRLVGGLCGMKGVRRFRSRIVPEAQGRVVEIGIGPGHNLPLYDPARVERIWGVDPVLEMTAPAARAIAACPIPVELIAAGAESIPLETASADCAVLTYTACTLPDVPSAMAELRRVLKPGGQVLFCEHGASCDAAVCRWQDRLDPLWARLAGGCHLNRRVDRDLREAGFDVELRFEGYMPWTPKPVGYTRIGAARRRD
ncbi:MAG TPA: class I SAM-dependent methyltransferase [Solimonas sp.]